MTIDTTPLEDAFPRVLPYVNGAPSLTVLFHLREAAIEFMSRTLAWRVQLDPVLTEVDVSQYDLVLPDCAALVKLLRYKLDAEDGLDIVDPDKGQELIDRGYSVDAVWTTDRTTFHVNPVPKTAGKSMVLTAALKPALDATEIPTTIFDHYIDAIASGAIGRIAALPRQSFSDREQAALHMGLFKDRIDSVALQVARGFGRTSQRVRGHYF